MTKQEIYEQVVQLTSELHATNVAEKIFSAAKEGDPEKVEEVFETFKEENPKLYARIVSFGRDYNGVANDTYDVFGSEEDEENGSYVFDPNTINAETLYVLSFLGEIEDGFLFAWRTESSENYVKAIEEAGYKELAKFAAYRSVFDNVGEEENYQTIYDCLVGIFKGDFE